MDMFCKTRILFIGTEHLQTDQIMDISHINYMKHLRIIFCKINVGGDTGTFPFPEGIFLFGPQIRYVKSSIVKGWWDMTLHPSVQNVLPTQLVHEFSVGHELLHACMLLVYSWVRLRRPKKKEKSKSLSAWAQMRFKFWWIRRLVLFGSCVLLFVHFP